MPVVIYMEQGESNKLDFFRVIGGNREAQINCKQRYYRKHISFGLDVVESIESYQSLL